MDRAQRILLAFALPVGVTLVLPGIFYRCLGPLFVVQISLLVPVGMALVVAGMMLMVACLWDFAVHGRGAPSTAAAPFRLGVGGIYSVSRHPLYLGMAAAAAGEGLASGVGVLLVYGACSVAAAVIGVSWFEEPALRRMFSVAYDCYCERTPRWLGRPARRSLPRELPDG